MQTTFSKSNLSELYLKQGKSTQEIAEIFHCSVNKVRYWMKKYKVKARTISEAVYKKNNPDGDPFKIKKPRAVKEAVLFGMGLGLYWGEGTKANKYSVRIGNTDSNLIKKFILFLEKIFQINKKDLKFSLQLFNDINETKALKFWTNKLGIEKNQFYKTTITKSVRKGSCGKKSEFGVLTLYYHNKKMRNILNDILESQK